MPHTLRRISRLFAAVAVMLAVAGVSPAQDDDEDDDDAAPMPVQVQVRNNFMANDQNFEIGVFGSLRNASAARTQLEKLLTLQTDDVDRACSLSEAQKKKLALAARGDVKRFFDRVDEKRKVFQLVRNDQAKFQLLYQELMPLQTSLRQGFFGETSLFSKTLRSTLDAKQFARYETVVRERRLYRYRAKIDLILARLDSTAGLDSGQRQRLLKLIQDEVRPPKKFSSYDEYVISLQLARLPDDKLKAIFNEGQWRLLGSQFDSARRMETYLLRNDYLPEGWKASGAENGRGPVP